MQEILTESVKKIAPVKTRTAKPASSATDRKYYGIHVCIQGDPTKKPEAIESILKEGLKSLKAQERGHIIPEGNNHKTLNRADNVYFNYFRGSLPYEGGTAIIVNLNPEEKAYKIGLAEDIWNAQTTEEKDRMADEYARTAVTVKEFDGMLREGNNPFGKLPKLIGPYYSQYSYHSGQGTGEEIRIEGSVSPNRFAAVLKGLWKRPFWLDDAKISSKELQEIDAKTNEDLAPFAWTESGLPVKPVFAEDEYTTERFYPSCLFDYRKYMENKDQIDGYLKTNPFYMEGCPTHYQIEKHFSVSAVNKRVKAFFATKAPRDR